MSNVLSLGLLTQRREDAKMMEARAKELLKELNPDSRVELKIDFDEAVADSKHWFKRLWGISTNEVTDHNDSALIAQQVLEGVVATFPEVKMRYWMTWEGPLAKEAVSVNGKLVEIDPWTFVVHVADSDTYQRLLDILNTMDLLLEQWPNRHSIGWRYDKNTEEQQAVQIAEEISRQMGGAELLLYRYRDGSIDPCLEEYAVAHNGRVDWVRTDPNRLDLMDKLNSPISLECDTEPADGVRFTVEDILIRPDVVQTHLLSL